MKYPVQMIEANGSLSYVWELGDGSGRLLLCASRFQSIAAFLGMVFDIDLAR
jgi:hypothetical protein